jgi:hypothetical protein
MRVMRESESPMQGRASASRRKVWLAASAAAGLIFFYCWNSFSPADVPPMTVLSPAVESRALAASIPAATGAAHKLAVNGVVMAPASKAALISVDDRPAALFVEGQQLAEGVVLYSVNPDRVVVKRGDELLRLPLRGNGSAGSGVTTDLAPSDAPLAELPPPAGTEERRNFQSRD